MDKALEEAALPEEPTQCLRQFFHHMATFLMNKPG
jgi:hypothetical protein